MTRQFFFYTLLLLTKLSAAQLTTALVVNPAPVAVLSEWANDNTVITYVINYQGATAMPVLIKAELKTLDGTVVATKDLSKAQNLTVQRGTQVFYAKDVFPLQEMNFTGSTKATIERTGKLPSGNYQLTVQLVRPGTFDPASEPLTRNLFLASAQLPILMKPYNGEALRQEESQTAIILRWTPAITSQRLPVTYRLQVFEILNDQKPLQALRGNQPLLDIVLRGQTQYIWRHQLSFANDSLAKQFIWTIQTLDSNGDPLVKTDGNGESRSEPFQFSVSPVAPAKRKE